MIIRAAKRKPAPEPEPEPEESAPLGPATAFEDVKFHFAKYTGPDEGGAHSLQVAGSQPLSVLATTGWEPEVADTDDSDSTEWRVRHRMKTVSVAIVVCLNVGVDPPDVIKTSPCARMECWIDPLKASTAEKALDKIGRELQLQYERWQPKAICKASLDPTMEEVKKLALTMRRKAKDERVLFHYNGHGVPKPTENGEIWVFNKNYTQYIPLSLEHLLFWVGSPAIYVIDCSNAGQVLRAVQQAINRRNTQAASPTRASAGPLGPPGTPDGVSGAGGQGTTNGSPMAGAPQAGSSPPSPGSVVQEILLLASCSDTELLPMNPAYPADLFTACLTTPIKMALRWFISTHSLIARTGCITEEMLDSIPGSMIDRKTPKGELNWIFTAVTDSIAWNVLPRKLFQRLFRQDLLVASLFRNFLLAERILHSLNVTPCSIPKLPPTHNHPMWSAWDFAADMCLAQLPRLRQNPKEFKPSTFFQEQLTAFEVWLSFGAAEKRSQPEQLPIVLQVLLSQTHRLRALELLARFLDMGRWAVMHALSVGIFPYVLRLLQSPAADLRRVLVFIWTKILSFDISCQSDLVKDKGQKYFLAFLNDPQVPPDQRVIACFVLCAMCAGPYKPGQIAALQAGVLRSCLRQLSLPEEQGPDTALLLRWLCLCVASCCDGCDAARVEALRGFVPGLDPSVPVQTRSGGSPGIPLPARSFPTSLQLLLKSAAPALRAAAVNALGNLIGGRGLVDTWAKSQQPLKSPAGAAGDDLLNRSGIISVAYAGPDRQALPLGIRGGTVVLAAEYVGGGGGAGDSAAAVLPGSRLVAIDGQSVEGLSLDAMREIAEESAPTTLQFDGSAEADEWVAKEIAVAWILIHSLYDADGAVRIELVNGLAQFVAHHIDALLEALSDDDRAVTAEETTLRQIWSSVLTLRADPLPSVADRANLIWVYVTAYRPPVAKLTESTSMSSLSATARQSRGPVDEEPVIGGSGLPAPQPPPSPTAATAPPAGLGSDVSSAKPPTGGGGMTRTRGGMLGDVNAIQRSQSMMMPRSGDDAASSGDLSSQTSTKPHTSAPVNTAAGTTGNPAAAGAVGSTVPSPKLADTGWLSKFTSTLYKENAKHFATPLMQENLREPDPALLQAKRRRWEQSLAQTAAQLQRRTFPGGVAEEVSAIASFEIQLASLDTEGGGTSQMMFLPHQPYLLAADEERTVAVWDYAAGRKIGHIDNGNPTPSRISCMDIANEQNSPLLIIGSDDGAVRVWRGTFDDADQSGPEESVQHQLRQWQQPELLTAWHALSGLVPGSAGPGLVTNWRQSDGLLLASGDAGIIRIWDMEHERQRQDIATDASITCLSGLALAPAVVAAGRTDGGITLYDIRVGGNGKAVVACKEHTEWVVDLFSLPDQRECALVSGSGAGDVKFWDIRLSSSNSVGSNGKGASAADGTGMPTAAACIKTIQTEATDMSALAVHGRASIFAAGSCQQQLQIFQHGPDERRLGSVRYHSGFLRQRIGPVTCMEFHPTEMLLAVGATDNLISMYRPSYNRR